MDLGAHSSGSCWRAPVWVWDPTRFIGAGSANLAPRIDALPSTRPHRIPGGPAMTSKEQSLWKLLGVLYKPHPWHGVSPGDDVPSILQCFVEVVPSDTVKYEVDKISGYLKLDRPQKYSNVCPALYGFVPQTLCADRIGEFSSQKTGRKLEGDGDPLDI